MCLLAVSPGLIRKQIQTDVRVGAILAAREQVPVGIDKENHLYFQLQQFPLVIFRCIHIFHPKEKQLRYSQYDTVYDVLLRAKKRRYARLVFTSDPSKTPTLICYHI